MKKIWSLTKNDLFALWRTNKTLFILLPIYGIGYAVAGSEISFLSVLSVVLGGMIEQSKKHTVKKIPLLGDLPFIGWLFRRTTTENEPVNLLIFVTATVINDRGEYVRTRAEGEALPSAK